MPLRLLLALLVAASAAVACAAPLEPVMKGRITFIDPDGTVVVAPEGGKSSLFYVRQGTRLSRQGTPIGFPDLKVGDLVDVRNDRERGELDVTVLPKAPRERGPLEP